MENNNANNGPSQFDTLTNLTIDTWVSDSLVSIGQGDTDYQRSGDRIEITGYLYLGTNILFPGTAITDVSTVDLDSVRSCRVIVVQLKRNTTIAALETALAGYDTAPTNSLKLFNIENLCYILYDKVFLDDSSYCLYSATTEATSVYIKNPKVHSIRTYIKPKVTTLAWLSPSGNSTTPTAPTLQGAMYVLYLYNDTGASPMFEPIKVSTTPDARITFRDK